MIALVAVDLEGTRFLLGLVEDPAPGDLVWVLSLRHEQLFATTRAELDPAEWRPPNRLDLSQGRP